MSEAFAKLDIRFTKRVTIKQGTLTDLQSRFSLNNDSLQFGTNIDGWSGTSLDIRQDNTGTINIQNSGNPSATGSGINFSNTTLTSTSPATNCPDLVGSCYSPICTNPTPSGNSNQVFCSSDSPTIADLFVTGGSTIAWYNSSTFGISYSSTDALIDGNSYWAADESPGCDTSFRFEVVVSINDAGDAGLPGALTVCQGIAPTNSELFAALNGTPDAGGTWTNSGLGDFRTQFVSKWDAAHLTQLQSDWDADVIITYNEDGSVNTTESEADQIARKGARPSSYSSY